LCGTTDILEIMHVSHSLSIDLDNFAFFEREKIDGKTAIFRCHRDFIYYSLNYYYPERYNVSRVTAQSLEKDHKFGLYLPWWLMWTMLQLTHTAHFLKENELTLYVNGKHVRNWFSFVVSILIPYRMTYEKMLNEIENGIENGEVVGIDVAIKLGGLIDHVIFVYGYDEDNVYVFDTHQIKELEYEKVTDDERFIMKLPKEVLKKRCGPFARIWRVVRG